MDFTVENQNTVITFSQQQQQQDANGCL